MRHGIPICLGYFAVSFAFGIQAAAAGISPLKTALMSMLCVTSTGQFAALEVIATGGSYITMALLQLVLNLRYLLMSTALSQKLSAKTPKFIRMLVAYGITDEIFALSATYPGALDPVYSFGLIAVSVPGWTIGAFLGAVAGEVLPKSLISAFGIALYGMFIAIIIPEAKKNGKVVIAVLAAAVFSLLLRYCPPFNFVPAEYRIIVATIVIAAAAAALFPVAPDGEDAEFSPAAEAAHDTENTK